MKHNESFGMALVEAMACVCVPVITDRVASPEVAGEVQELLENFGFVVKLRWNGKSPLGYLYAKRLI